MILYMMTHMEIRMETIIYNSFKRWTMEFKEAMNEVDGLLRQKEQLMIQKQSIDKKIYDVDKKINDIRQREARDQKQNRQREVTRNAMPARAGNVTPAVPGA